MIAAANVAQQLPELRGKERPHVFLLLKLLPAPEGRRPLHTDRCAECHPADIGHCIANVGSRLARGFLVVLHG